MKFCLFFLIVLFFVIIGCINVVGDKVYCIVLVVVVLIEWVLFVDLLDNFDIGLFVLVVVFFNDVGY